MRWYIGYDLGEPLPDHSSLSKIRTRYGLDVFRRFFDTIVEQCQQEKLVWGKELYIDSTQVNANADLDSLTPRFAVEARAAIQAHLAALFAREDAQQEQQETSADGSDTPQTDATAPAIGPVPLPLPVVLPEAVQEELASENTTRHDWIEQEGRQQREVHGLYQRTADFKVSTTDPDATPMRLKGGGTHLGYHVHYVVDGGKARIILQVLVTPSEVMDNQPVRDLIFRSRFRWKLRPRHVTGDTKYGTIENIKALEDAGIRAYVPLPDWEHQRPYFGPAQFTYDSEHDRYSCPNGQLLHLTRMEYSRQKAEYSADAATCNACPLKAQCTPSDQGRQVHRSFHANYLERVRSYHQTQAYQKAMRKRKVWVEPLFAEAKDWHGMRRFRLRRLWRVNCEAQVIAAGQNLKRLLKKRGWGRRPFPTETLSASFFIFYAFCSSLGRESFTNACPTASTNRFFQRESWFFRRRAQLSPLAHAMRPLLKMNLLGAFSTGWTVCETLLLNAGMHSPCAYFPVPDATMGKNKTQQLAEEETTNGLSHDRRLYCDL